MIRLETPDVRYRESLLEAMRELKAEGAPVSIRATETVEAYVARLSAFSDASKLPPGYVPSTEFWIVDEDGYAGRISLRHFFNEHLAQIGGHVGYAVRPSKRGRGYATQALRLVIQEARAMGLERLLVTCDDVNLPSRRVIEKNGGVLQDRVEREGEPAALRYWIDV